MGIMRQLPLDITVVDVTALVRVLLGRERWLGLFKGFGGFGDVYLRR